MLYIYENITKAFVLVNFHFQNIFNFRTTRPDIEYTQGRFKNFGQREGKKYQLYYFVKERKRENGVFFFPFE